MLKQFLQKYTPRRTLLQYHKTLAIVANVLYRFPSRGLKVIGVTGTNGKTTTSNLIWAILTEAGYKAGLATTINFKIGKQEWVNKTKQGMQGRFRLQKLLRKMVSAGCQYAVIETTSEGIKQYRHWGIRYAVAVFTNLTAEHIESHGSFEQYQVAKGKLFAALRGNGVSVVNGDDHHAPYFLAFQAREKWAYLITNYELRITNYENRIKKLAVKKYKLLPCGTRFNIELDGKSYMFGTKLLGLFNIYNCIAAITAALSQGIEMGVIQRALKNAPSIPGRMEIIRNTRCNITAVVDYAHDPAALENVYTTLEKIGGGNLKERLIAVLGAVGGGRDTAKRSVLGALASRFAKYVIITNEDPYNDDPNEIMNQVEEGVLQDRSRALNINYWKILDRRAAIQKAVSLADPGGVIALTGKGCEEVMAVADKLVPWDDRAVLREAFERHQ